MSLGVTGSGPWTSNLSELRLRRLRDSPARLKPIYSDKAPTGTRSWCSAACASGHESPSAACSSSSACPAAEDDDDVLVPLEGVAGGGGDDEGSAAAQLGLAQARRRGPADPLVCAEAANPTTGSSSPAHGSWRSFLNGLFFSAHT